VIGDNADYWIGRRFGDRLFRLRGIRRFYDEQRLRRAQRFFDRRGWLAVFFGRFVAVLRMFAGPLAGSHRMPWPRFLVANSAGAACWVAAVVTVGLLLGSQLDRALRVVSRAGYVGLAIALLLLIAWLAIRRFRRRVSEPRRDD